MAAAWLSSTTDDPGDAGKLPVQHGELAPVRMLLDVQNGDRRLQDAGRAAAQRQCAIERRSSLSDQVDVPERSILVREEDDRAAGEPRIAAGIVGQHQREGVHGPRVRRASARRARA